DVARAGYAPTNGVVGGPNEYSTARVANGPGPSRARPDVVSLNRVPEPRDAEHVHASNVARDHVARGGGGTPDLVVGPVDVDAVVVGDGGRPIRISPDEVALDDVAAGMDVDP